MKKKLWTSPTPSPSVSVEAAILDTSSSAFGSISLVAMTKPNSSSTYYAGVANSNDPLQVLVPNFDVKSIEQSTPFADASNVLTATLSANYDLPTGSTVTIQGLIGSATGDADLTVTSTDNKLGTSGEWSQDTDGSTDVGSIEQALSNDLMAGVTRGSQNPYTLRFILRLSSVARAWC